MKSKKIRRTEAVFNGKLIDGNLEYIVAFCHSDFCFVHENTE